MVCSDVLRMAVVVCVAMVYCCMFVYVLQKLGCLPINSSWTWSSTLDPVEGVAYAMGGKSTSYRTLYTIDIVSGKVIDQPTTGYAGVVCCVVCVCVAFISVYVQVYCIVSGHAND